MARMAGFRTVRLGDFGCHMFDPVFTALELGDSLSVRAEANRLLRPNYREGWHIKGLG